MRTDQEPFNGQDVENLLEGGRRPGDQGSPYWLRVTVGLLAVAVLALGWGLYRIRARLEDHVLLSMSSLASLEKRAALLDGTGAGVEARLSAVIEKLDATRAQLNDTRALAERSRRERRRTEGRLETLIGERGPL